ncbi:hypothetical protein Tco_0486392 [Tanacetum coccineum]
MAAAGDLEEVNAIFILMANLQQTLTSSTQTDKALVYDSDGSTEVYEYDHCYNNEIFNMFTQEEQYINLLEPIPKPHQVQQNENNVISAVSSVEQNKGTVKQNPATIEETRAYFESLYNNLAIKVKKVNTVNYKIKETNDDLTTELARYKNQEKCFEINQEKYDKLEMCYQNSVYQEKCLTKKINALHLSSAKTITTLNEKIANLNNQLSKEKSTVSSLQEENKKLKFDFKTREDELLDKQIQLEKKIKELDNILVFVSQKAKSREELYFSNTSKMASVFKKNSIPHEEFSDDTSPSVAQKFLNEVKSTIVTLQRVVKQKMTLDIHNWSSSAHQELHKIVKDENFPIVNQVDARVQNFEIQFLKEAAKFVQDFKSLAKEADESIAKHRVLEHEIDSLLRAVVSQDILSIVQNNFVVDTSNLQTNLDRTKEKLETCIIKKEKEYGIKRLQAQLGDLKGKSQDTPCVSDTLDPLSQKLEYENVSLEFQVLPKIDKSNALSKPVTSNLAPFTRESKFMNYDRVIAPGMFRINPFKTSREEKLVPSKHVKTSVRTKSIIVSQPHVITKKDVNSNTNGLPSTGVESTAKTRRPQPMRSKNG